MHRDLLRARDARQALIERAGGTLVFASTCIPGPGKNPEGLARAFAGACERLASHLETTLVERGHDALGPWALFRTSLPAAEAKRATVRVEARHPAGRLIDLDIYDDGRQVGRASLGMRPRTCLVCDEPAVECIRVKRHGAEELAGAVRGLLAVRSAPDGPGPGVASARPGASRSAERLAACLVTGARVELALTPKPGLVDRDDNGSHPDLSFALMTRSIDLLPGYFEELMAASRLGLKARLHTSPADTLAECLVVGRRAERRMLEAIGSNAHRGYIFLGGLALLGAVIDPARDVRDGIRGVARATANLRQRDDGVPLSHGAAVRTRHALGGIEREALDGLPAVFDHALPALRGRRESARHARGDTPTTHAASARDPETDEPLHYAMAILMQVVEDTTAVHRCGPDGLARLREDGHRLQTLIERRRPYRPWLRDLNLVYRRLNLTMGGVADCLALTVALDRWLP